MGGTAQGVQALVRTPVGCEDRGVDTRPEADGYVLVPTGIGVCAVAWRGDTVVAVALPEADAEATARRIRRSVDGPAVAAEPPEPVAAAVRDVVALLEGEPVDLRGVEVDVAHRSDFERRVFAVVRSIPPGETLTYGEVAARVGEPGGAQAVGRAMGSNPVPIIVPCHRVVGADGRPVGFSAPGGTATKQRILRIEGAAAGGQPTLFDPPPGAPTGP